MNDIETDTMIYRNRAIVINLDMQVAMSEPTRITPKGIAIAFILIAALVGSGIFIGKAASDNWHNARAQHAQV